MQQYGSMLLLPTFDPVYSQEYFITYHHATLQKRNKINFNNTPIFEL